jgi:hypothetical protein
MFPHSPQFNNLSPASAVCDPCCVTTANPPVIKAAIIANIFLMFTIECRNL